MASYITQTNTLLSSKLLCIHEISAGNDAQITTAERVKCTSAFPAQQEISENQWNDPKLFVIELIHALNSETLSNQQLINAINYHLY